MGGPPVIIPSSMNRAGRANSGGSKPTSAGRVRSWAGSHASPSTSVSPRPSGGLRVRRLQRCPGTEGPRPRLLPPPKTPTMKLLFVSNLGRVGAGAYTMKWRAQMKLLFVNHLARFARSTYTISRYAQVAGELGHEVAVFGEPNADAPSLPYSLDVARFDFALFVVHIPSDFPDLPYLARLLDQMPKERRIVIDCLEPIRDLIGPMLLTGWDWGARPEWDVELGLHGADVEPDLLRRIGVKTEGAIPFDAVSARMSEARFSPIVHRPLFNELRLVTNRTFETFCADTLPLLILPEEIVDAIYGDHARPLTPDEHMAARV